MAHRNVPQVLELPSPFDFGGGAGMPSQIPSRESRLADQVLRGGATQVLGAPRKALMSAYDRMRGGCCPCPGQKGRRGPQDQPPYTEPPGLGQPSRPQRPFQGPDKDPCEEALARAGIDMDCLRQAMGKRPSAPRRRRAAPRRLSPALSVAELRRMGLSQYEAEQIARTTRARRSAAPRRRAGGAAAHRSPRGKYQLLRNGACFDPVARKFVKRVLCR